MAASRGETLTKILLGRGNPALWIYGCLHGRSWRTIHKAPAPYSDVVMQSVLVHGVGLALITSPHVPWRALGWTVEVKHEKLVRLLLREGARLDKYGGWTYLQLTAKREATAIVDMLLHEVNIEVND